MQKDTSEKKLGKTSVVYVLPCENMQIWREKVIIKIDFFQFWSHTCAVYENFLFMTRLIAAVHRIEDDRFTEKYC